RAKRYYAAAANSQICECAIRRAGGNAAADLRGDHGCVSKLAEVRSHAGYSADSLRRPRSINAMHGSGNDSESGAGVLSPQRPARHVFANRTFTVGTSGGEPGKSWTRLERRHGSLWAHPPRRKGTNPYDAVAECERWFAHRRRELRAESRSDFDARAATVARHGLLSSSANQCRRQESSFSPGGTAKSQRRSNAALCNRPDVLEQARRREHSIRHQQFPTGHGKGSAVRARVGGTRRLLRVHEQSRVWRTHQ